MRAPELSLVEPRESTSRRGFYGLGITLTGASLAALLYINNTTINENHGELMQILPGVGHSDITAPTNFLNAKFRLSNGEEAIMALDHQTRERQEGPDSMRVGETYNISTRGLPWLHRTIIDYMPTQTDTLEGFDPLKDYYKGITTL
jgi:hypothetical protein